MATVDECRQALQDLAARLDDTAEARGKLDFDRTLACRVPTCRQRSTPGSTAAGCSTSPTATTARPRSP